MDDGAESALDALEEELKARAESFGWTLVPSPQLVRESSAGAGVEGILEKLSPQRNRGVRERLPASRRAFELQPALVGILLCGLDTNEPDESYRSALWWSGLVRSEIAPAHRSDLHLFLVAPAGTCKEPVWHERRGRIESDERFCRKFVWLPPEHPEPGELGRFLDRTFLATPWMGEVAEPRSLDPLERLASETDTGSLSADEMRRWIVRLGSFDNVQQIAEDLASILETEE